MQTTALAPGLVVAGKYSLDRPLARGAMGEVWIATHRTLGNEVAIKFLARASTHEAEDEATAMARFRFEAQVASKLSRKTRHIVAVTDHGEELGFAYLVMELVDGESLETMMRRAGRTSLAVLAPIVAQLAKALAAAHGEGVFHRDLKPANVLLTRDEDGGLLVKILDFGIAKTVRSHKIEHHQVGHSTDVGIVLGTPNYMSPEQARGLANLDHRCDLWALATVIYEALCGVLPYEGETTVDLLVNVCSVDPVPARTHRPDLPESLDAFFTRAFAPKAKHRYQDAASFAAAFAEVVAAGTAPPQEPAPVRAPPVEERSITGVVDAVTYEPPRSKTPLFVALAAVLVLGAVFFFVRGSQSAASPSTPESKPAEPRVTESAPPVPAADPPAPAVSSAPVVPAPSVTAPPKMVKPSTKVAPSPPPPPTVVAPPPAVTQKKPVDKGEIL